MCALRHQKLGKTIPYFPTLRKFSCNCVFAPYQNSIKAAIAKNIKHSAQNIYLLKQNLSVLTWRDDTAYTLTKLRNILTSISELLISDHILMVRVGEEVGGDLVII